MMGRMMSARIEHVAVAPPVDAVGRQALSESGKSLHTLVAARGPAALEQHDELRRMRVELGEEFRAQPLDRRRLYVVIEVEVVEEPGRLRGVQAQQRVDSRL